MNNESSPRKAVAKAAKRTLKLYVFVNSAVFFGSMTAAVIQGVG